MMMVINKQADPFNREKAQWKRRNSCYPKARKAKCHPIPIGVASNLRAGPWPNEIITGIFREGYKDTKDN
jgi:hypothetical protein